MKRYLTVVLILSAAIYGCSKQDKVVTKIGSDKITLKMLAERINETPQGYRSYLDTPAGKKQFLDLLVRERIVLENARRSGLNKGKEYVQSLNDFKKEQSRRLRDYEENVLMELYIRDLHEKTIKASDAEIDKYYSDNKSEFLRPVLVKARHILLSTRADAEAALKRVKSGEDFSLVARQVSTDPVSAPLGGEIGPFKKGDLVPEFEQAVFALKLGQVSGVVETQFGFHVIKKTEEKPLPVRTLEQSKQEIRRIVEKTKFDSWLEKEKNKYSLKVNYDLLNSLPSAPAREHNEGQKSIKDDQKPIQKIGE